MILKLCKTCHGPLSRFNDWCFYCAKEERRPSHSWAPLIPYPHITKSDGPTLLDAQGVPPE